MFVMPYETFPDDLKKFDRAAKSRAAKYRNGTISTTRFMDGIYNDLRKCANAGKIHVFSILMAMYQETIIEYDGPDRFYRLVKQLAAGADKYKEQGSFLPFIPF